MSIYIYFNYIFMSINIFKLYIYRLVCLFNMFQKLNKYKIKKSRKCGRLKIQETGNATWLFPFFSFVYKTLGILTLNQVFNGKYKVFKVSAFESQKRSAFSCKMINDLIKIHHKYVCTKIISFAVGIRLLLLLAIQIFS